MVLSQENHYISNEWFVYILQCNDGTYYVGHTEDLNARIAAHNKGTGAIYTAIRAPVVLKYHESHTTKESAIKREAQLKNWSRAKKEALISGDIINLKKLSICHHSALNS
jgi:predicted GIY-YIG superfamily endonuclease